MSLGVYEAKHKVLREALRGVVLAAVDSGNGADGIGSIQSRASSALYALLCDHEIDRRGRCRCCRGRGAVVARRRTCRVFVAACFYLHQPDHVLLSHLASELQQANQAPGGVADPHTTHERPRVAAEPSLADPDHGGAGEPTTTRRPRSRRAPPPEEQAPPNSGRSLVVTAGGTSQA